MLQDGCHPQIAVTARELFVSSSHALHPLPAAASPTTHRDSLIWSPSAHPALPGACGWLSCPLSSFLAHSPVPPPSSSALGAWAPPNRPTMLSSLVINKEHTWVLQGRVLWMAKYRSF